MSDDLRVDYGTPESLYERLDHLVDTDPIALRDVAWNMAQDVEILNARIAELEAYPALSIDPGAEARGYDRAVAEVLALHSPRPGWERLWHDPDEALAKGWPLCAGCDLPGIGARTLRTCPTRALFVEAAKETPDVV
jgi:hypothetical protein